MRQLRSLSLSFIIFYQVGFAQESAIKAFKSDQSPVVDGKLNEPIWNSAVPFSGFKMVEPFPGSEPTEKTEVRIIYDQSSMYIGVRCFDREPRKISANTMEHDKAEERNGDQVSILIDPFQAN